MAFNTIDDLGDLSGKRALVRVDLNVPMADGRVTDLTRIHALAPTVNDLSAKGAKVLLLGMQLPPNYGPRYTTAFAEVFGTLAKEKNIPLVPFFLDGVGGHPDLMQADGLHPAAGAQGKLLENVWPTLKPLL